MDEGERRVAVEDAHVDDDDAAGRRRGAAFSGRRPCAGALATRTPPLALQKQKQENHSEHCVQLILQNKKQTTIETGKLGKRCCRSSKQKATEQK